MTANIKDTIIIAMLVMPPLIAPPTMLANEAPPSSKSQDFAISLRSSSVYPALADMAAELNFEETSFKNPTVKSHMYPKIWPE